MWLDCVKSARGGKRICDLCVMGERKCQFYFFSKSGVLKPNIAGTKWLLQYDWCVCSVLLDIWCSLANSSAVCQLYGEQRNRVCFSGGFSCSCCWKWDSFAEGAAWISQGRNDKRQEQSEWNWLTDELTAGSTKRHRRSGLKLLQSNSCVCAQLVTMLKIHMMIFLH